MFNASWREKELNNIRLHYMEHMTMLKVSKLLKCFVAKVSSIVNHFEKHYDVPTPQEPEPEMM